MRGPSPSQDRLPGLSQSDHTRYCSSNLDSRGLLVFDPLDSVAFDHRVEPRPSGTQTDQGTQVKKYLYLKGERGYYQAKRPLLKDLEVPNEMFRTGKIINRTLNA